MLALSLPEPAAGLAAEALTVPLILLCMVGLGRWLKRRTGVRLGNVYKLFSLAVALFIPLSLQPLPMPPEWRAEAARHVGAIALLSGTICFLTLLRRFFWEGWFARTQKMAPPKFLSEIVSLLIFLAAALVVFGGIYHQSIQGAIFGSTVAIGIVGFAMQDLLGNLIAGVALEMGKPFRVGDWLVIDQKHAEVIEVNWRSTRLRTSDDVYLDIPNKTIVGSTIVNLTYPTRAHALRIPLGLEYSVPPNRVKDLLAAAAAEAPGVLNLPAPKVFIKDFAESAVVYEIKFWIENESAYNEVLDAIRTNVWYATHRQGLHFPFPVRTVHVERPQTRRQNAVDTAQLAARKHPFLQMLDERQMSTLIMHARLQRFGRGEKVITQGDHGDSMFILLHGIADVFVSTNGRETKVARLEAGDFCGEMSLLTGEPRSATVVAHTDCELWEIDKQVMGELLHENETLVQRLSDLLAERRMVTEGVVATTTDEEEALHIQQEYAAGFFKKLCSFFDL